MPEMTESKNRIQARPLEETINFLRDASRKSDGRAGQIYRSQTTMLQWLRRKGHPVDFSPIPIFEPMPKVGYTPPSAPLLRQFDGKRCPYCRDVMKMGTRKMPTRDHVRPRRAGVTLANGNCLVVCELCNNDKADMMLSEFVDWLTKRGDVRASFVRATIEMIKPQEEIRIGNTIVVCDDDDD